MAATPEGPKGLNGPSRSSLRKTVFTFRASAIAAAPGGPMRVPIAMLSSVKAGLPFRASAMAEAPASLMGLSSTSSRVSRGLAVMTSAIASAPRGPMPGEKSGSLFRARLVRTASLALASPARTRQSASSAPSVETSVNVAARSSLSGNPLNASSDGLASTVAAS